MEIKTEKRKKDLSHYITLILGIIVLVQCSFLYALLYAIITFLGMIWFIAKICPHCRAFGTAHCSSGYGRLSSKMFKRPKKIDFKKAFKRNIVVVAFQWFIPLFVGLYCIYLSFDFYLLLTIIIFIIVAFIWLPLVSRKKGCKDCPQKGDCAWSA